jgi:hypothetical protein
MGVTCIEDGDPTTPSLAIPAHANREQDRSAYDRYAFQRATALHTFECVPYNKMHSPGASVTQSQGHASPIYDGPTAQRQG